MSVADGEIWVIPALKYVWAEASASPDVDGPMMPTTFGSDAYFCASARAGAAPCSTGVSPWSSWIFRPYCFGRVATAYFAQLSCSVPRKPAPPVIGVTIASFIGLLQLMLCA